MFGAVLRRGLFGFSPTETAAFIIQDGDKNFRCVMWAPTNDYHEAHFREAMPAHVVAIVHTHPNGSPRPSQIDRLTAIHLGISIFAVTISSVYEVDAAGVVIEHERNRHWFDPATSSDPCPTATAKPASEARAAGSPRLQVR